MTKRKLSKAQKAAKAQRRKEWQRVFMNGKAVWVRKRKLIDGLSEDEFLANNADDIFLVQAERYDLLEARNPERLDMETNNNAVDGSDEIPF